MTSTPNFKRRLPTTTIQLRDLIVNSKPIFSIAFIATALALTSQIWAQLNVVEESTDHGTRYVYKMTITPAAESLPAFKHRFTIPNHKTIPGNSITHYLRSFGEGGLTRAWDAITEEVGVEEFGKFYTLEPGNLSPDMEQHQRFSRMFDGYVDNHIRRATLCRENDWGLNVDQLRGPLAIEFLLPSVQSMRGISRMLSLRTRLAIREGRYDDAVDHLRMNFKLGQNISSMNVLVTQLVAIAICGITENNVIEFMAAPESPNLYWALAELPRPLISVRESMQAEASFPVRLFPVFEKILADPKLELDWRAELQNTIRSGYRSKSFLYTGNEPKNDDKAIAFGLNIQDISGIAPIPIGLLQYGKAKQRLIRYDFTEEQIEKMPVGKVLLIDAAFELQVMADELVKSTCEGVSGENFEEYLHKKSRNEGLALNTGVILGGLLFPAVQQVQQAETRLTWQLNALQNIEAIRMHAANHGSLPRSLKDIKLYLPDNPFTKQPYVYRRRGKTAIIEMPFTDGVPGMAQRFELTLAEKK